MKYIVLFVLVIPLFFWGCKKVQPELDDPQNTCDCIQETTADFFIEEMTVGNINFARYTNTDSILGSKNVRFRAKDTSANYTWYIGVEVLNDQSVTRFFGPSTLGQTVPIALVVQKESNTKCFPNDDGYDSIVKYLTITNYPNTDIPNSQLYLGSIEGTYRVKSPHLADSFDITVDAVLNSANQVKLNLTNYDGQGSDCIMQITMDDGYNYRELFLTGGTGTFVCDYIRGSICNPMNGKAQMDFTFFYEGHPNYEQLQYLGRKLN